MTRAWMASQAGRVLMMAALACFPVGRGRGTAWAATALPGAPGQAVVQARDGPLLTLAADAEATEMAAAPEGRLLVLWRLVGQPVREPLTNVVIRQEWAETGAATVTGAAAATGQLHARLAWEDGDHAVAPGDRAELVKLPAQVRAPQILSLTCSAKTAAPGQTVWLRAETLCPLGGGLEHRWTADAGEFVLAGGASAGRQMIGPRSVRWRAPSGEDAPARATIRLQVTRPGEEGTQEARLSVAIAAAGGTVRRVRQLRTARLHRGWLWTSTEPLLGELGPVAAGPRGSFCCADQDGERIVWWRPAGPRQVDAGSKPVLGLNRFGDAVYWLQGSTLQKWDYEAEKPFGQVPFRGIERLVDLQFSAAGDAFGLDDARPARLLHLRQGVLDPTAAPLEDDAGALRPAAFALDPLTCDAYVLDPETARLRVWRSLSWEAFRASLRERDVRILARDPRGVAGPAVAVVRRPGSDRFGDVPVGLAFARGAVCDRWARNAASGAWEPVVAGPPAELEAFDFTARAARRGSDGDFLLAGEAQMAGARVDAVAQVSPQGEFRGILPFPELPPASVAFARDGACLVLLSGGSRRSQRVVQVGLDGWLLRDFGQVGQWGRIVRVRADRGAPRRLLILARTWGTRSVVRVDLRDPSRSVKIHLSEEEAQLKAIPRHRHFTPVDVDSTAEHIFVLGTLRGESRVYMWTNDEKPNVVQYFNTGERAAGLRVLAGTTRDDGGQAAPFSLFCLMPAGGARCLRVWEYNPRYAGKPTGRELGLLPDPRRASARAAFSSVAALATGGPQRPERLYVLDGGRGHLRAFDMVRVVRKLRGGVPLELSEEPLGSGVVSDGELGRLAVGPGQAIVVADPDHYALHVYERRP